MSALEYLVLVSVIMILVVIVAELIIAKKKNVKIYTLSDSLVNLFLGMLERVFDFFYAVLFLMASNYIYENVAPFKIPPSIWSGIAAILMFDFLAYWFHRLSHEINFLWAAHIVHHQSEELNITTVFRVSFFAVIYRSFFFILMPLVGFDAYTILFCGVLLGVYQLFTHSRLIGKLGFLERFMTTPSHHRVHHGRNEKYMDHNYGHIFIIWDRLFGTFTPEEEEPVYGITTGFESSNPYTAEFSYWDNMFTRAKRTKSLKNKILVFLKGPAWTPDDSPHLPPEYKTDEKGNRLHHQIQVSRPLGAYILFSVLPTIAAFVGLIVGIGNKGQTLIGLLENKYIIGLVLIIAASVFVHGKMLEQQRPALFLEFFRLLFVSLITLGLFNDMPIATWLIPTILASSSVMAVWLLRLSMRPQLAFSE